MKIMKNKYERMTKEEKKEVYNEYKNEKKELARKMERMLLICKIGIAYFILTLIYDFILFNTISLILDGLLLLLCIVALIKTRNTKIDLLNTYVLEKDKKLKSEIAKKYKNKTK